MLKKIKDWYNDYIYYRKNKKAIKEILSNNMDTFNLYKKLLLNKKDLDILKIFNNTQSYNYNRKKISLKAIKKDLEILNNEDYYSINKKYPINVYSDSYISYTLETMLNIIRYNHCLYDLDMLKYENGIIKFTIDSVIGVVELNNILELTKKSIISYEGKITPTTISKQINCISSNIYIEVQLKIDGDYEIFLDFINAFNKNIKIYTEEVMLELYRLTNKDMDQINHVTEVFNNYIEDMSLINPYYDEEESLCMFNLLDNIFELKMDKLAKQDEINYLYLREIVKNTVIHNWDINKTFN